MGLIAGSLGKIGLDVTLLMATEIGEVYEPFVHGRGASSTMPQKRNPISSEILFANAKAVRQHCGLMLDALMADLERATGPWHLEWLAVSDSLIFTAGALHQARHMLDGLTIDADRMCSNLEASSGLIVAEAVMMALAPRLGRQTAHEVVYRCCRETIAQGRKLGDVLAETDEVNAYLSRAEIDVLTDPTHYLGSAGQMVDSVIAGRRNSAGGVAESLGDREKR